MNPADAICTTIDMNYSDSEFVALFGPNLGPYIREKLREWRMNRHNKPMEALPRHHINGDSSRLIAVLSRLETVEREIEKLRLENSPDLSDLVEQNDFDYLEERVSRLEFTVNGE